MNKRQTLSPTMLFAFNHALLHGNGKLCRFPGGFWAIEGWKPISGRHAVEWFGTTTVEAIVSRGRAEYTAWKERNNGTRFPIEVTMLKGSNEA